MPRKAAVLQALLAVAIVVAAGCEATLRSKRSTARKLPTPLHDAIRNKNLTELRGLIDGGVDIERVETAASKSTALVVAVNEGPEEAVLMLLQAGADVSPPGRERGGGLVLPAAKNRYTVALRMLIAHGADVNEQTPAGESAVAVCAEKNMLAETAILLEAGAEVNRPTKLGVTPLSYAARHADMGVEMLQLLIGAGADVNRRDQAGATPLIIAASLGAKRAVELLLDSGAVVDTISYAKRQIGTR